MPDVTKTIAEVNERIRRHTQDLLDGFLNSTIAKEITKMVEEKPALQLSSPWSTYYHELYAMFKEDDDIFIKLLEDEYEIKLYVNDAVKAAALEKLLPHEKDFGNVKLKITVCPSNRCSGSVNNFINEYTTIDQFYKYAFRTNPTLVDVISYDFVSDTPFVYVMFKKEVVQYYNDALNDPNGLCSTLYQEIAKDIFTQFPGVFYCTTTENNPICF